MAQKIVMTITLTRVVVKKSGTQLEESIWVMTAAIPKQTPIPAMGT